MTRVYAIGDVHGHLDQLHEALARIAADRRATGDPSAPVVQIGDLVDRGPDSRGVVRFLMSETARDPRLTVLRGVDDMAALMGQCDLIVSGGGSTTDDELNATLGLLQEGRAEQAVADLERAGGHV